MLIGQCYFIDIGTTNYLIFTGSKSAVFCMGIGGDCSRPRICNERSEESADPILYATDIHPN